MPTVNIFDKYLGVRGIKRIGDRITNIQAGTIPSQFIYRIVYSDNSTITLSMRRDCYNDALTKTSSSIHAFVANQKMEHQNILSGCRYVNYRVVQSTTLSFPNWDSVNIFSLASQPVPFTTKG